MSSVIREYVMVLQEKNKRNAKVLFAVYLLLCCAICMATFIKVKVLLNFCN